MRRVGFSALAAVAILDLVDHVLRAAGAVARRHVAEHAPVRAAAARHHRCGAAALHTRREVLPRRARLPIREGQAVEVLHRVGQLSLEDFAARLFQIAQGEKPGIDPARIYTVAGDHGVVAEGVSLFD